MLAVLLLIIIIVTYFISAFILSYFSTSPQEFNDKTITCYIYSNGIHTDLVAPRKNSIQDWDSFISPKNTKKSNEEMTLVGFGWGDKGFYLETPTWADLKFSTAIKAGTGLGCSAMHTTYFKNLSSTKNCIELKLSEDQYKLLVRYIKDSFEISNNKTTHIETNSNYGNHDTFYEAKGSYSIFKTCNTWTNNGLKRSKIPTCIWTPFADGIMYQARKNN